jgi:hypothetical protein
MPGLTSCSPADGLSRPAAGRMCGANSSTSTPPPAHPSPKKRSIALASSTQSRRRSTDHRPTGDDSSASCSQSRLPRHWRLGPSRPCANSPASPNSPKPSATCGRAGLHWCAASTMAAWHSTTIPPSVPCVASRCGVHCTPLVQVSGNIGSWFAGTTRHGRPVRPIAAATRSCCRSSARIW